MGYVITLLVFFFLAGCGKQPAGEKTPLTPAQREEREKNVFWQYTKPEAQEDPIFEEDAPAIIYPGPGEEKQ